jgi:hypothetical protein
MIYGVANRNSSYIVLLDRLAQFYIIGAMAWLIPTSYAKGVINRNRRKCAAPGLWLSLMQNALSDMSRQLVSTTPSFWGRGGRTYTECDQAENSDMWGIVRKLLARGDPWCQVVTVAHERIHVSIVKGGIPTYLPGSIFQPYPNYRISCWLWRHCDSKERGCEIPLHRIRGSTLNRVPRCAVQAPSGGHLRILLSAACTLQPALCNVTLNLSFVVSCVAEAITPKNLPAMILAAEKANWGLRQ